MCSLCGLLGGNEHWTDAAPRPGVFTRNIEGLDRRRERMRRVAAANRILSAFGMRLADWQGSCFMLATLTGKSEVIEDLGHLWPAAERLSGRLCDPLDPALVARMEESPHD
ncbi:hypothetical protein [Labrys neptuniae]